MRVGLLVTSMVVLVLVGFALAALPVPGYLAAGSLGPRAGLVVYDDALADGWQDWSWNIDDNLANSSPVHAGTASIAVTFSTAWDGFKLGRPSALDISAYDRLQFWIHGGSGGQEITLQVGGLQQKILPQANAWTQVSIPLDEMGSPRSVGDITWWNGTGSAQAVFYLDDISFVSSGVTPTPVPGQTGPSLVVDAAANRRPISPLIYGMNFADPDLAAELDLPVNRWGGNATTRYNWQLDVSNRASDWYFENIANKLDHPELLPDGSSSDQFVEQNRSHETQTLLTVPLIGWTPKSREFECGARVSRYGAQEKTDPWQPDCGNGKKPDGDDIANLNPLDTSLPITITYVQDWMRHLVGKYGTAASGGVRFYALDNEPMLWSSTHLDVHPQATSYDEMRDLTYAYAAAIKAVDPEAQTLGPVVWGWTAYFWSTLDWESGANWWDHPQDRLAHGDVPFLEWYLQQMRAYEQAHDQRILDYLDIHYYPQSIGVSLSQAGDAQTQAKRLECTRSLWDDQYLDGSWIDQPVNLIPRMHQWVDTNYPGTHLALTEYNWGGLEHINGALAQAEVLGIFGRQGLDLATLWDPPRSGQPGAYAFRIYRNYDGQKSRFGETGVQAASSDPDRLSIFAARRSSDGALTLVIINKDPTTPLTSTVSLENFSPAPPAQVYRYSKADLAAIHRQTDLGIALNHFTAVFPAYSITLVVIPAAPAPHRPQYYLPISYNWAASTQRDSLSWYPGSR